MKDSKWFLHPILILTSSITAVALSLTLYIYWYMEISTGLKKIVQKTHMEPDQVLASETWVVILVLSILVGIITMGIFTIFIYHYKTSQLYRLQNNFINNFTHELKTPITSLKLYLETFQKYELSREDQLKYIGYMVQDADRLSNNVSRILNLARIESRTNEKMTTMDLIKVIDQFHTKNSHLFKEAEINIQNPSGQSFPVAVNVPLFEMLLMNLFTNAIKYNDSSKPKLDISFRIKNNNVIIQFNDNGIGLPKSERKKIFKKFYQIGQSENMSAKGTGLGLYLVDSIVKTHKGTITAEPNVTQKGSVFTLILPIKTDRTP